MSDNISINKPINSLNTNQPLDIRTLVNSYSDIQYIPNPYIGMTITVKVDETNDNKMTDYKVKSLKSNELGMNNTVINEIERLDVYVGIDIKANNSDLVIERNRINNLENTAENLSSQLDNLTNESINKLLDKKIDSKFEWFGYNCINIVGDSITHGANAPDIYKNSWAELLRKSLQSKYNTFNQGFEKAWGTISNSIETNMKTFHNTIYGANWNRSGEDTNNISLSSCYTISTVGELHFVPRKSSKFRIIYESVSNGGTFNYWLKSAPNLKFKCNTNVPSGIGRPFFTELLECNLGDEICIQNTTEGQTVKILGVQYFENEKDLMINNYGRSGAKLSEISDDVLYDYAKAGVIFFSFGHNDSFFPKNNELFTQKINTFINAVNETGAYVVVNDFCWDREETYHTRKELKRLKLEVEKSKIA